MAGLLDAVRQALGSTPVTGHDGHDEDVSIPAEVCFNLMVCEDVWTSTFQKVEKCQPWKYCVTLRQPVLRSSPSSPSPAVREERLPSFGRSSFY